MTSPHDSSILHFAIGLDLAVDRIQCQNLKINSKQIGKEEKREELENYFQLDYVIYLAPKVFFFFLSSTSVLLSKSDWNRKEHQTFVNSSYNHSMLVNSSISISVITMNRAYLLPSGSILLRVLAACKVIPPFLQNMVNLMKTASFQ